MCTPITTISKCILQNTRNLSLSFLNKKVETMVNLLGLFWSLDATIEIKHLFVMTWPPSTLSRREYLRSQGIHSLTKEKVKHDSQLKKGQVTLGNNTCLNIYFQDGIERRSFQCQPNQSIMLGSLSWCGDHCRRFTAHLHAHLPGWGNPNPIRECGQLFWLHEQLWRTVYRQKGGCDSSHRYCG